MNKNLIILIGLTLMLVLAGCLGPSEGTLQGDMNETEFKNFVTESEEINKNLETYSVNISADVNVEGHSQSVSMDVSGNVNQTAKIANLDYDMRISGGAVPPTQPTDFTAYFDEDYMYMESADGYDKIPIDDIEDDDIDEVWELDETTALETHYHYGDVSVEVDDNIITVTTELDGDEMEAALEEEGEDVTGLDGFDGSFEDTTIVEEYGAESYMLKSVTMDGAISASGETATFTVDTFVSNHNEDVDYDIPDGVKENATEPVGPTPF